MSLLKKGGTTKSVSLSELVPPVAGEVPAAPNRKAIPGTATPATISPLPPPPTAAMNGSSTGGLHGGAGKQMLPNGTVLQGRYAVEGVLGIGGMSTVYRGRDLRFKDVVRPCAIKEMFQRIAHGETRLLMLKNFEREAGLLATLSNPAIPKVFDFFEEAGKIYLIMELVPGQDLEAMLEAVAGPLPEAQVGAWALQICDVAEYLHGHRPDPIIFRDMKPSNLISTPDNRIVLIDFGIARLFLDNQQKGTMIGTEGYAPPEQYRGIADQRGDIYALGATLHHLLTGDDPRLQTPFTFHERPVRQLNPDVSVQMEQVVMQALQYDPQRRPQSMRELKAMLAQVPTLHEAAVAIDLRGGPAPLIAAPVIGKASGATTAELVWKFACEDEVRSSPLVHGDAVYVGSYDTNLYCLDALSGQFRWKRATQGGISSSPAIWAELVLVGSEDGHIYAIDTRRGLVKWSFATGMPVRSSPKVEDRIIYVGSDDQHIYALDGQNGRPLWKHRAWMPVRSSCALTSDTIYVGSSDGHIYALDAFSGSLRWKLRTQGGIISTPAVGNSQVFVGSMDSHIYAMDAMSGTTLWRFKTGHAVNGSPALSNGRLYGGSADGNVYALDAKNGKLIWKYETGSQITSSARVSDGRLYVGGIDHALYCLDADTGSLLWKYMTQAPVVSSPAVFGGIVYIGSMDHHLYALKA